MVCGHGHEQKIKHPYPRDSKIIQIPYPRAKAINQNPALCSRVQRTSWQVDYLVSGCSNPTSLPLFLLTTSHPSTQILLTPFSPSPQKLIHCFAMNELNLTLRTKSELLFCIFISYYLSCNENVGF